MHSHRTFINWSSGKDAAMALLALQREQVFSVDLLLTTVNRKRDRVSMHGLPRVLLEAQARAIGLPLEVLEMDENPSMSDYRMRMTQKLQALRYRGYTHAGFGDIFLEDLKKYRENLLAPTGMQAVFPLWNQDTRELLLRFIDQGFKALVVCCRAGVLHKSFCGRLLTRSFLKDLPQGVDPCGENGEFHTFCFDGPNFAHPVPFTTGGIVYRTYPAPGGNQDPSPEDYGFWFCDLKPEGVVTIDEP